MLVSGKASPAPEQINTVDKSSFDITQKGEEYPNTSVQEECAEGIRKFKKSFMLSFK